LGEAFQRLQESSFRGWRLAVDGMVARPTSFSLADLQSFPRRSQITHLACEEGWSYIAEWIGSEFPQNKISSSAIFSEKCPGRHAGAVSCGRHYPCSRRIQI
jgi:hypothetical protein